MSDYEPKCKKTLPIIFDDRMPASNLTPKLVGRVNDNTEDLKNLYEETETMQGDIDSLQDGKADASGTSENLTAGNAEQLATEKGITERVPYLLRASGGNGADREEDKIVGGTVAWNQLVKNGNFADTSDWSRANSVNFSAANNELTVTVVTPSGGGSISQTRKELFKDHKYFISWDANPSVSASDLRIHIWETTHGYAYLKTALAADANKWTVFRDVFVCNKDTYDNFTLVIYPSDNGVLAAGTTVKLRNIMLFDLTQMFGTYIADRAYAMEQSTAGSGIAWLKSMGFFQKDYYPYDAGSLKSVEGLTAHSMVGFNQWDEEWESGSINIADGTNVTDANAIRSKNYIPVMPGVTYYFKAPSAWETSNIRPRFYACDKTYIGSTADGGASVLPNSTFAIPSGCYYMRFSSPSAVTATTYNHDVCVNISDPAKNGTYEPYVKHSYPLDSTLTLRGIPKLDSNNELYYDGDEYESDGTVTRKYGLMDLGTLNWVKWGDTTNAFVVGRNEISKSNTSVICPRYPTLYSNTPAWIYIANYDKVIYKPINGNTLVVRDTAYDDAATFKASLSGVYIVYPRETESTETADPYQNPQILDPYGTEEYVTTGIVPVGHETFYPENLRAKIEGLPFNFAALIAPTETTYKATRAYTTGNLFIVNNILYKATTSIASGGTITPGTNCTATTLAEIIAALS